jgi:hypothetical protein
MLQVRKAVKLREERRLYCYAYSHHVHNLNLKYRVIHKSLKHFKNSQQINYASDHGNSYADREGISPSFL